MTYRKVTLSANQIQKLAVFLALNNNIERVTIEETNESGIGACHHAVYHTTKIEREFQEDITDVGNW